jgi:DUF177 domain-containing protein
MVKPRGSHANPAANVCGTIDPARFARDGASLTGSVSPASLPRVAQELFDEQGAVGYLLEGVLTPKGEPALRIALTVEFAVACQRCMERLPLALDIARTLVLSGNLGELDAVADEDDDVDAIPLVPALDVIDLIDQEVMLSLAIAPRHADGTCDAQPDSAPDSTRSSPFAVLSNLKRT